MKPLKDADVDLVYIHNGTPHCKKHGAMNKLTKEGIWRCISTHGIRITKKGNQISRKEIDNLCVAGCHYSPTKIRVFLNKIFTSHGQRKHN